MLENYRKGYRDAQAADRAKTARRLEKKAARNASIGDDLFIDATAAQRDALVEAGWELVTSFTTGVVSTRYTMKLAAVDRAALV